MYPFVFSFVNKHDCGFFMLQRCKTYHCREDGVIEMLDYSHEDILPLGRLFCIPAQLAMCLMLTSGVCLASNPVRVHGLL